VQGTKNWFSDNGPGSAPASAPGSSTTPAATALAGAGSYAGYGSNAALGSTLGSTLTDNPNGEGIYRMKGPDGKEIGIPYSKAKALGKPQGYTFADDAEMHRFMKDYVADPQLQQSLTAIAADNPALGTYLGFAKHALRSVFGLGDIAAGPEPLPNLAPGLIPDLPRGTGKTATRQFAEEPAQNVHEKIGGMGEDYLEFARMLPELKGSAKLQTATKLAQIAEKHPIVAQALKNAGVAGAQEYTKTSGDVGSAATAAALTGGTTAAFGGLADLAGGKLRSMTPGRDVVAGQEFDTPAPRDVPKPTKNQAAGQAVIKTAAQDTARGHLQELNESRTEPPSRTALPARTGPFEFNLRGVTPTPATEGQIAQSAARVPGRAAFKEPQYTTASAPTRQPLAPTQGPTALTEAQYRGGKPTAEGQMGANISTLETPEAQRDIAKGGGTLTTQDPNIARAHVENLNRIVEGPGFDSFPPEQQRDILSAREDAQRQLSQYHEEVRTQLPGYGKPQMAPVDIPSAIGKIGSYSDAAAAVKQQAMDGYKQITDALAFTGESPQKLSVVRLAYQSAENKYMAAETPEALRAAEGDIEAAHEQLRDMMQNRIPNAANMKEFSGLNDAYRNALGLEKFSRAVDGSFTGSPTSGAQRAGEYYGFDGKKMGKDVRNMINSLGRGAVDRLVGRENVEAVLRVADLNTTTAGRAKFGAAIRQIGQALISKHVGPIAAGGYLGKLTGIGWEAGAGLGWGTAEGMERLSRLIVSKPQLAKNLLFALDAGAKPENYGPFIATMIRNMIEGSNSDANQTR
jgi:hypothetical protein